MSRAKDLGNKLSPLANRKQTTSQGILLLKAEKQSAFHRQRNRATISHSQSTTVLYIFFFQKESSHGSWMPFPFSASIHRQDFTAFWDPSQLSRLAVGGPGLCSITHHLPSVLHRHPHVLPTQHRDSSSSLESILPAAFWPAHRRKQMSPTSESKERLQIVLEAWGHADSFPISQEKWLLGWGKEEEGRGEGRKSMWELVPWQKCKLSDPDAQA